MSIASFILSDYIMFAELLGLWVMLGSNVHLNRRTISSTRLVIMLIFVESLLSAVEHWTRTLDYLTMLRVIITPTVYLLHPVIMLAIMSMADFLREHKFWIILPVLVSAPLIYTSQWTHLIYWFSADNVYHAAEGVLRYYPYVLFLFYIVIFISSFSIHYARHGASERKGILISIVVAMIGMVLHIALKMEVDYSTLFASILLIYYLSLYVLTAKEDTLTHLLNRQCYYADSVKLKDKIVAVVSVDMNDLKKINDTEGHDAGDTAIKTIADCLIKTSMSSIKNKSVYRIGGDEFAIFYMGKTEEEVHADIDAMRARISMTPYECAFGCEMVTDADIERTMQVADRRMYANKAILKDSNERRIAAHKEATIKVMHEALGSGMWGMEFDENGNMVSVEWSPEFREMIGYTDENDFPNELESWSNLLHPDDRVAVLKEYNDTINDYSGRKNYDVEYRLKTKSGEWKWFHAIGRLLRRDNGVPLSYVGMFVDITDQKLATA